jgi:phosphoribosylamine--glycine ligase
MAAGKGTLIQQKCDVDPRTAVTMVMVSGGYPGNYKKGIKVTGLMDVEKSIAFHAGTTINNDETVTAGGRVFAVTSLGSSIEEARQQSLKNSKKITFEGKYYRKDIGFDLM